MAQNKSRKRIKDIGDVAFLTLEAVAAGAAACPPLQSVAGGALHVAKLTRNFKSDKKSWNEFGDHVHDLVQTLAQSLIGRDLEGREIKEKLEKLAVTLDAIRMEIEQVRLKSTSARFFNFAKNPQKITELKQRLDESLKVFNTGMLITANMDLWQILDTQKQVQQVGQLLGQLKRQGADNALVPVIMERCLELIESTIGFNSLPSVPDAGWNSATACLPGTRTSALDTVMTWVDDPDLEGMDQLYLMTDVVGSGKTAFAHSVAQKCSEAGVLVSSFFYDLKAGRIRPRDFLITLARDLGLRSPGICRKISLALQREPALAVSQSLSRIFQCLILDPVLSSDIHLDGPLVVVIDALNEGENQELCALIRNEFQKLPRNLRIFMTTRPERAILHALGPDIRRSNLHVHEDETRQDITAYITHRLTQIAERYELANWPSPVLISTFLEKTEGLFLWASVVCDYLLNHVSYPGKILEDILHGPGTKLLPPEERMDSIYATILQGCPWTDHHFVNDYGQVMGAVVVLQTPLSVQAIQDFHDPGIHVKNVLSPLGSLINGVTTSNEPTRILHTSFRDFVTTRVMPESHRVRAKFYRGQLGILCLRLLNQIFARPIEGTGYLTAEASDLGIPNLPTDAVSEAEWYAIRFWPFHLVKISRQDIQGEDLEALCTFLSQHLVTCIEVLVSKLYQPVMPVARWLETTFSHDKDMERLILNRPLWHTLSQLPLRLICDGRVSEALEVVKDLRSMHDSKAHQYSLPWKFERKIREASGYDSDDSMVQLQDVSDSSDEYSDSSDEDDEDDEDQDRLRRFDGWFKEEGRVDEEEQKKMTSALGRHFR